MERVVTTKERKEEEPSFGKKVSSPEEFVSLLFKNDVDKAGAPYYHHCEYVANYGRAYALSLGLEEVEVELVYLAGLCHDVLEDKGEFVSEELLVSLIGEEATKLVKILTNTEEKGEEGYACYFSRVKENRLASIVKLADANHNADLTRFPEALRDEKRRKKSLEYMKHAVELMKLVSRDY